MKYENVKVKWGGINKIVTQILTQYYKNIIWVRLTYSSHYGYWPDEDLFFNLNSVQLPSIDLILSRSE